MALRLFFFCPIDIIINICLVFPQMRRELKIRVTFAPTRQSSDYLRTAYDMVFPAVKRVISQGSMDDGKSGELPETLENPLNQQGERTR